MSFLKFKIIVLIIYFSFVQVASAISGKDINYKVKLWLSNKGYKSNPEFLEKKILPSCEKKIVFKKHFNSFKLVNVICNGLNPWSIYVKTNVKTKLIKNGEKKGKYSVIKLSRSKEKGEIILINDLKIEKNSNKKGFFKYKNDLIGRKLKQNLREGQIIKPRHLFKKYYVNEGEPVLIESRFKNTSVSTGGIAMEPGNLGDALKVKNVRSGKIIKGYLKKNKIINVFF